MAKGNPKRPRDPNQLARLVIDLAAGSVQEQEPAVVSESARKGGLKGVRILQTQVARVYGFHSKLVWPILQWLILTDILSTTKRKR